MKVANVFKISNDLRFVNVIAFVRPAIPIESCLAPLAIFARDIVEELVIAREAPAILRRAPSFAPEKLRIQLRGSYIRDALHNNSVFPVVAYVVNVTYFSYCAAKQHGEFDGGRVIDPVVPVRIIRDAHAEFSFVSREFPQMGTSNNQGAIMRTRVGELFTDDL